MPGKATNGFFGNLSLKENLKNQGKRVEVMAFGRTTSSKLKEIADEFIDMEKNTEKYLLHAKRNLFNLKIGKINIKRANPNPKWKNSN